jgi:hypothetical protein
MGIGMATTRMSQKNLTTKQSRGRAYLICPHCGARKPMQPLDAMVMCLACHEILLGKDMLPSALTTERLGAQVLRSIKKMSPDEKAAARKHLAKRLKSSQ